MVPGKFSDGSWVVLCVVGAPFLVSRSLFAVRRAPCAVRRPGAVRGTPCAGAGQAWGHKTVSFPGGRLTNGQWFAAVCLSESGSREQPFRPLDTFWSLCIA